MKPLLKTRKYIVVDAEVISHLTTEEVYEKGTKDGLLRAIDIIKRWQDPLLGHLDGVIMLIQEEADDMRKKIQ